MRLWSEVDCVSRRDCPLPNPLAVSPLSAPFGLDSRGWQKIIGFTHLQQLTRPSLRRREPEEGSENLFSNPLSLFLTSLSLLELGTFPRGASSYLSKNYIKNQVEI